MRKITILLFFVVIYATTSTVVQANDDAYTASVVAQFMSEQEGEVGDQVGTALTGVGDVNGDGYDDFAIGADTHFGPGGVDGAVYLVLGGPQQWSANTPLSHPNIIKFTGEPDASKAGASVAGAGDFNGDGFDDILVGAPQSPDRPGVAYLILGSPNIASGSLASAIKWTGEVNGGYTGNPVAGVGDVNGDGYDDAVIFSFNFQGNGKAYLVLGNATPTGGSLSTAISYLGQPNDKINTITSGDVNGDGYNDMAIGAFLNDDAANRAGIVYIVLGSANPTSDVLSNRPNYTGLENETIGYSLSTADVNRDGISEIIVGAPDYLDNLGNSSIYILRYFDSATLSRPLTTSSVKYNTLIANDNVGRSVAGVGDVNGDGFDDIITRNRLGTSGAFLMLHGGPGIWRSDLSTNDFTGYGVYRGSGDAVAGVGDVNGDGYADFVTGFEDFAVNLYQGHPAAHDTKPTVFYKRLSAAGDTMPLHFDQARMTIDFSANALADGGVHVARYTYHPCTINQRLHMPIWSAETNKVGTGTSIDLTIQYTDGQIQHMDENSLQLWHRPINDNCGPWTLVPSTVRLDNNSISASVTELGYQYTIADGQPPTSVEMSSNLTGGVRLSTQPWWAVVLLVGVVLLAGGIHYRLQRINTTR